MDISWAAIGKLLLAGLCTYVVFPAVLVLRDFILWAIINNFILNEKLEGEIRKYAIYMDTWNKKYTVNTSITNNNGKTTYTIDGDVVSFKEHHEHFNTRDKLGKHIEKCKMYINRKSNFLTWMLKHYKQDSINPINEWVKNDIERIKLRDEKLINSASIS